MIGSRGEYVARVGRADGKCDCRMGRLCARRGEEVGGKVDPASDRTLAREQFKTCPVACEWWMGGAGAIGSEWREWVFDDGAEI